MNRKFLLLFSILIVAIGAAGIMINTKHDEHTPYNFVDSKKEKEVEIVLAQSTHESLFRNPTYSKRLCAKGHHGT